MQRQDDPAMGADAASSPQSVESAVLGALILASLPSERRSAYQDERPRASPNRNPNKSLPSTREKSLEPFSRSEKSQRKPNREGGQLFEFNATSGLLLPPRLASPSPPKSSERPQPPAESESPPESSSLEDPSPLPLERPHHRQGHLKQHRNPRPSQK